MALSQDWRPVASHSSFYTGGAIQWSEKVNAIFGLSSERVVVFRDECVVASLESEGDGVLTFAVSPNGASVVTSHRSTLLRQWALSEDKWTSVQSWRGHSEVISDLAFDVQGRFLASGGLDRLVKVWDFEGRYVTHNFQGHSTMVTLVRFHPRRLHVISIADDAEIRVWDMKQNTIIACLKDHLSRVSCVTFFSRKEEDLMVSGGRDNIVNIWSLQNYTLKTTIPVFESVEGVVVFQDEKRDFNLLTVGDKGLIRLWDDKGKCLKQIASPHGVKGAMRKAFKVRWKNAEAIATIGEDRHIIFWNLSLKIVARFMAHCEDVVHCQFAGERLLVVGSDESPLIVDPLSFRVHSMLHGHRQGILAAYAQDDRVCTGGKDHEIRVWNDKGKCQFVLKGHAGDVTAVLLPHNLKKHRLLISGSADKTLKLWALPEEGDSAVEVTSSKLTKVEHAKDIMCLAISLNDKMLASGSQDKLIKIFSFPDFAILGECKGHRRGIWSMQFSPRDKVLASASGDATIRLWNLADFSAIKAFEGHAGAVLQVRFLANAMQLMSSGSDGLLKLWNIRTTDCLKTFEKHEDKVWGMDMMEERMVSGGDTLIVWEDCSAEAVQEEEIRQADMRIKDSKIAAHLQKKQYSSALTLALELGKLGQLKSILEIWALEGLEETNSKMALKDWVESLSAEHMEKLLKDVLVKWNTNGRTAHLANLLLRHCLPRVDMKMEGLNAVTDAFTAYGDRHLQRWDQICQQTFMIDLLLQGSTQTLPQAAADTAKVLFDNDDLSPRASVPLPAFVAAPNARPAFPQSAPITHVGGKAEGRLAAAEDEVKSTDEAADFVASVLEGIDLSPLEADAKQDSVEEKTDAEAPKVTVNTKKKKKKTKAKTQIAAQQDVPLTSERARSGPTTQSDRSKEADKENASPESAAQPTKKKKKKGVQAKEPSAQPSKAVAAEVASSITDSVMPMKKKKRKRAREALPVTADPKHDDSEITAKERTTECEGTAPRPKRKKKG